jgi:ABC-type antimicrobial peptide transport system permease subunit
MFLRDSFLAWRKLVRRPGAALLAIVSLALALVTLVALAAAAIPARRAAQADAIAALRAE